MKSRRVANFLMSRIPDSVHDRKGREYAVRVANEAIKRTRAYPKFLKEKGVGTSQIESYEDFQRLPLTTKKEYIDYDKFALSDLVLDGRISQSYTIETSSGYSGTPYYWPRLPQEDEMFPTYLEFAFTQFYNVHERSTLVVITLALGTWISGEKMAQALREIAATGKYPLTVITPGSKEEEVISLVKDLAPMYEQTIIVGLPSFIKILIEDGQQAGIDWKKLNVRLGLGGDSYSEAWRNYMAKRIGIDPDRDLLAISGGYGAADIGMTVGREYPLTVIIRRLAERDKELARALFHCRGDNGQGLPSLLQYNPATVFIEGVEGELVFTTLTCIPLVRYRIHDRGGVISFSEVMSALSSCGYDVVSLMEEKGYTKRDVWRLPFFYCHGRTLDQVSSGGALIYTENVEAALSAAEVDEIVNFKIESVVDKDENTRCMIHLQHRSSDLTEAEAEALSKEYHDLLLARLQEVNRVFKSIYETNPKVADPLITVHASTSDLFFEDKGKIKQKHLV
ncbi:MAG: phenylacetate--CoA ligase family protein [Actinobacteria bacterium]|nr:MAG: phenylacetate--CoA ligase family protein [Actinomycetota bacterium]